MENELAHDFPLIKVYKDGRAECLKGTITVPPSLDPITSIQQTNLLSPTKPAYQLTDPTEKLPLLVYFNDGAFCTATATFST